MCIDETGRRERNSQFFFCLCGIIVDKSNLISLNNDILDFKGIYGIENLKDLRTTDQTRKLSSTNELFNLLHSSEVDIVCTIIGNVTLKDIYNTYIGINQEVMARYNALIFLIERFYFHLNRRNKKGLIIFDSLERKMENELRKKCYYFIHKHFKHVIYPSILFCEDEYSEILQIADLIGLSLNNAIYRSIDCESEHPLRNLNVEDLPTKNQYLETYWPLFEKNPNTGRVEGWGVKVWI